MLMRYELHSHSSKPLKWYKLLTDMGIKGLRHEDFAVLGQLGQKSWLVAFTHTQNAPVKL